MFHLTKFIVSRLNREVLLRKGLSLMSRIIHNVAFQMVAIYLIGFAMVRVVKAWDFEHSDSVGTTPGTLVLFLDNLYNFVGLHASFNVSYFVDK